MTDIHTEWASKFQWSAFVSLMCAALAVFGSWIIILFLIDMYHRIEFGKWLFGASLILMFSSLLVFGIYGLIYDVYHDYVIKPRVEQEEKGGGTRTIWH